MKKGLESLLHQEGAIARISRGKKQVKGKRKQCPSAANLISALCSKLKKSFPSAHIIYIYIYIHTKPINGREKKSVPNPSVPKQKDTSSNHVVDRCP